MPASSRPRKAYRPRQVAVPVTSRLRDTLILPAYTALETLRASSDPQALSSARYTIGGLLDSAWEAMRRAGRDRGAVIAGQQAIDALVERHQRAGVWRCTGPELEALRAAVRHVDDELPYLDTRHLIDSYLAVIAAIDRRFGKEAQQ